MIVDRRAVGGDAFHHAVYVLGDEILADGVDLGDQRRLLGYGARRVLLARHAGQVFLQAPARKMREENLAGGRGMQRPGIPDLHREPQRTARFDDIGVARLDSAFAQHAEDDRLAALARHPLQQRPQQSRQALLG